MIRDLILYSLPYYGFTPRQIQHALDCRKLNPERHDNVLPIPPRTLVVNWGTSHYPEWHRRDSVYLNSPEAVRAKTSKVRQISRLREAGVPVPVITTRRDEAQQWLRAGSRVLVRRDGGEGGRGITVVEADEGNAGHVNTARLPEADFYSQYFRKNYEFRFHVFQGNVIDVAQKKRATEAREGMRNFGNETLHQRVVRSYDNGWIFAHNDLHLPPAARQRMADASVAAVRALNLDFGAVDVLAHFGGDDDNRLLQFAVCEVNSAPGVEITETIQAYATAIRAAYVAHKG